MQKSSNQNVMITEILIKKKKKFFNSKVNSLAIHEQLSELGLNITQMHFNAISLYPFAMCDNTSVYPKKEQGFVFKPHLNDFYLEAFNNQSFNQNGNESAILNLKYYNPANLIFQHLPVKERVKN